MEAVSKWLRLVAVAEGLGRGPGARTTAMLAIGVGLGWAGAQAGTPAQGAPVVAPEADPSPVSYGKKGVQFETSNGDVFAWMGMRFQWRTDSLTDANTTLDGGSDTGINRARLKGGVHLWDEALVLYSELDLKGHRWLDYRATWSPTEDFNLRVGQWKSEYNRERIDSSGAQEFAERSLSNYWFTLDRQLGIAANARLFRETAADSSVWLEFLSGRGLGANFGDDSGIGMLRWQWNMLGDVIGFGQGDLERRDEPAAAVTVGGAWGRTHYTRFSSSGGGQIPDFTYGDYELAQLMVETVWRWRGISWTQELHWKNIDDRNGGPGQSLWGGYVQVGFFPSEFIPAVPDPLQIVFRGATVDPDTSLSGDRQWEGTVGANWFFNGHRNKLTADVSFLRFENPSSGPEDDVRFRFQWDVSF